MSDGKLKALSTSKYVKYISVTKKHGKYDNNLDNCDKFLRNCKTTRKYIFAIYK